MCLKCKIDCLIIKVPIPFVGLIVISIYFLFGIQGNNFLKGLTSHLSRLIPQALNDVRHMSGITALL